MVASALVPGILMMAVARPIAPPEFTGRPLTVNGLPRITYTAHRGGALEVPENSMSGLTRAFRSRSAQVLDVDTRMLRDGTLVVMHDRTLDRTTDSSGPVRQLTAAQWRSVRLLPGLALRDRWRPERAPTVAEVLDRFGGKSVLMLEAKDPRSLPTLARMIRSRNLTRSVFVNTNDPSVARRAHRMGLLAQLWRSAQQLRTDDPAKWRGFVQVLDVDYRARDADLRRAAGSGIRRVWAHTVNTPVERDRALRLGCNGIITDAPRALAPTPVRGGRTR
jgi:glycerophosphoryl diester phosphodiesterase